MLHAARQFTQREIAGAQVEKMLNFYQPPIERQLGVSTRSQISALSADED